MAKLNFLQLYRDIFSGVDGSNISQMNRSQLTGEEKQALTYGEIEFAECVKILQAAGAKDNHIFVDLVSGEQAESKRKVVLLGMYYADRRGVEWQRH